MFRQAFGLTLTIALVGCTAVEQSTAPPVETSDDVETMRSREPAADAVRYTLVSANSRVRVLTFREGPMARFGHNHVIGAGGLTGTVWLTDDLSDTVVRIVVPAKGLIVDAADIRAEEGPSFADPVPEDDIQATRTNMLGDRLLNAEQFPFVRATCGDYREAGNEIDCDVEIAGHKSRLTMPLTVTRDDREIRATGEVSVTHEQLGLTPYSAAGGAIRVADAMTLKFDLVAQRLSDD